MMTNQKQSPRYKTCPYCDLDYQEYPHDPMDPLCQRVKELTDLVRRYTEAYNYLALDVIRHNTWMTRSLNTAGELLPETSE